MKNKLSLSLIYMRAKVRRWEPYMKEPKVTVIMPSLNVADYIRKCMDSVVCQTLQDLEVLCIDAGSTDGTREILSQYMMQDGRISIFDTDIRSYGYQVNLGISLAKGKYITIIETDDYIMPDMFQTLYELAEDKHLDYIKNNFWGFKTITGKEYFTEFQLVPQGTSYSYDEIVNTEHNWQTHVYDGSIWAGMYRRTFLVRNGIRLNETKGAAFQDIGFLHRVLSVSAQGYYLNRSFNCYRMDRDSSSINSVKCLQYLCQEYQALFLDSKFLKILSFTHRKGIYKKLILSYMTEYGKTLYINRREDVDPYDKIIKKWINSALQEGIIDNEDFDESQWKRLNELFADAQGYLAKLRVQDHEWKAYCETLKDCGILIFGMGARGRTLQKRLFDYGIAIDAFLDNGCKDKKYQESVVTVFRPEEGIRNFPDSKIIIAMKEHREEAQEQLLKLGINRNRISIYEP